MTTEGTGTGGIRGAGGTGTVGDLGFSRNVSVGDVGFRRNGFDYRRNGNSGDFDKKVINKKDKITTKQLTQRTKMS